MKDNFCNDSTSSFGTLTNIEAIEIAIITNQTNSISSSSSSAATTSSTEPSTSNTNISSISNSQNDINGDVQKQIIDISSELNKNAIIRYSIGSSDLEDTYAVNTKAYFNQIKPENDIKTYEDFEVDYDKQVELIIEKAAKTIENNTTCFRSGFYQLISFIFISIAWSVGNGLYAYVNVFAGHSPNFTCDMTSVYNNKSYNNNNFSINIDEDQCSYNVTFNKTNEMIKHACQKWIYDTSDMKSTIITEYNFVCDNNHKFETIYSLEQIGYVIGTLIFSIIADRVGRKPVFICVLAAMTFFGLIQFFVTNFYIYMMLGFIINVFASGIDSVSVPLVLEMVNTNRRTAFGMGMEYVWVIILTSLSLIAYLINTWRYLRLFIFLVLGVISISSYWLVQESVTWLISTNRLEKASKVIDWVARFNCLSGSKRFQKKKRNLDESFEKLKVFNEAKRIENLITTRKVDSEVKLSKSGKQCESEVVDAKSKKGVFMDIIRNPRYRLYVLIMSLNWFATALIYDGLQYLNSSVGTNIFVNWTLMNIVELPAQLVCHVCLSRIGRRLTTSIFLVLCGTTLISTSIISTIYIDLNWLKLALYVIAKFSATQAYSAVILHAPEIFPTHLRSFGYGVCLFSGKLTSVISPIISLYLTKIIPWLPPVIYGFIAIICGFTGLYVPETLNRPLPNSIEDVLKWTRTLSKDEWKEARKNSLFNVNLFKKLKCFFCKRSIAITPNQRVDTQNKIIFPSNNDLDIG